MNTKLELLPNEIFAEVFQYLDARDIFQAFYHLNIRFDVLLQSLRDFCVTLATTNAHQTMYSDIDPEWVRTITVHRTADMNLENYSNLRRVKFVNPTFEQLDNFEAANLVHLEHLSMSSEDRFRFSLDLFDQYNRGFKIFSNGFPYLESCSLIGIDIMLIPSGTSPSVRLRSLQVRHVSFKSYQAILSVCPNLSSLRFSFPCFGGQPLPRRSHSNLRRMIIDFDTEVNPFGEYNIDDYFSCVPNLEILRINGGKKRNILRKSLDCNWFAGPIDRHLLSLRWFKYRFMIYSIKELMNNMGEDILDRLEGSFERARNYRYQSKLDFHIVS